MASDPGFSFSKNTRRRLHFQNNDLETRRKERIVFSTLQKKLASGVKVRVRPDLLKRVCACVQKVGRGVGREERGYLVERLILLTCEVRPQDAHCVKSYIIKD